MPTQYTPERFTIGNLLSTTNPPIRVPDWQRNFSWTQSEVEVFWQDLLKFNDRYPDNNIDGNEYFIGSIVLVDNNTWSLLLDGQQRMATAAILISVIRDHLQAFNQNAATRTSNKFLRDFDDSSQQSIDKITLNRYDRDFFRREVLESRTGQYAPPIPTLESHGLIRRARDFFNTRFVQRRDAINNPATFNAWALRIQKILTQHLSVVAIVSKDAENAALVFETLNDRGIGLSTPDLLRNLILRRANEEDTEEIANLWGEILESEGDVKLKTFLRHFWISHRGDVKAQSLYREIKDAVETDNLESLEFSRTLRDAAIVYRDILNGHLDDAELDRTLQDLVELGALAVYPALLAAAEVTLDRALLRPFARALLVTYVRHTVIGRLENALLENVMYNLARTVRENHDLNHAIGVLKDFAPAEEIFLAAFGAASVPDRAVARYLLREIELNQRKTEELEVALPPKVHVEHIYPQTPKAGSKWDNHTAMINRLGNLTLLSRRLNTTIKNNAFTEKLPSYGESDLILTKALGAFAQWSPDSIAQRQGELATLALGIWSFPE